MSESSYTVEDWEKPSNSDLEWIIDKNKCEAFIDPLMQNAAIACSLKMSRVYMFYVFNFLVPCMLMLFMGIFTFMVPADSGERISLSATIFLAMMVFLVYIMDIMPPSSGYIPRMRKYSWIVKPILASNSWDIQLWASA